MGSFGVHTWNNCSDKKDLILLKFIVESFSVLNSDFGMDKINNIKVFSKWFGEIVTLEGSIYIFLASASIFLI